MIIPRGNGDMLWWTDHNCRHAVNLIFLGVVCENIWPAWKMIIGRWHHINMRVAYPANKIPQAIIYSLSLSLVYACLMEMTMVWRQGPWQPCSFRCFNAENDVTWSSVQYLWALRIMLSAIQQYLAVQIAHQVTLYNVVENLQTVLSCCFLLITWGRVAWMVWFARFLSTLKWFFGERSA